MDVIPYPLAVFGNKKLLRDAVYLAGQDVEFVVGYKLLGTPIRKKLTDMEPGDILPFCGPRPDNIRYYGRIARTGPKALDGIVNADTYVVE